MPRAKADQTLKKAAQKLASASRASGAAVKKAAAKVAKAPAKAAAKAPAKAPAAKAATTAKKAATTAKPAKSVPGTKATKAPAKSAAPKAAPPTKASKAPAKASKAPAKAPAKTAKAAAPAKAAPAKSPPTRPQPAPKPPVKAKKHVLDKFEIEQKALLLEERAEYVSSAEALKAEADQLAAEMEPGDVQFDEESGEGGTTVIDRERDLAMSAQARVSVEEIDHALAKLTAGTYGPCENCGQPIPKARLKALPHARLCVACKSGGLSRR
jgi:RNA polymerase-binding transcription factor DksA